MNNPVNPNFTTRVYKSGLKGVYITQTYSHDAGYYLYFLGVKCLLKETTLTLPALSHQLLPQIFNRFLEDYNVNC